MTLNWINRERLAGTFETLVRIDSISREEGRIAAWLSERLIELGGRVHMDNAGKAVGGDCGNLIAVISGNAARPLLLSAHMDTVEPGRGVRPVIRDGVFYSDGKTILGADDKSALAVILEVLRCLKEKQIAHAPLEVVFSICEEIGLLGAKHLDYTRISSRLGYVLDTRNPGAIITRAPASNHLNFRIHGKSAHAGAAPEKGINAIALAGKAIAQLLLGRIDPETTCNIGLIEGGLATNIVPDLVTAAGEVRSHDEAKLAQVTQGMIDTFQRVIDDYPAAADEARPRLDISVQRDFERMIIADDHPVVILALKAAADLGLAMETASSGGGSDANVFSQHGIITGILGTGMENVHTVQELVRLNDMVRSAGLLLKIIQLHSRV